MPNPSRPSAIKVETGGEMASDPRVLLDVGIDRQLDGTATYDYRILIIDDAGGGHTIRLDLVGARQVLRTLEHKLYIAAEMQA
jgi:hypothetical protein